MKRSLWTYLVPALVVLIVLMSSIYVLDETEQALILQLGKPVGEPIQDAGLHFKLPFIQTADIYDKRVLEWDAEPKEIPTSDKRYIWVDTFGRWRIADPLRYYQSVRGSELQALSRLSNIIESAIRNHVSTNELIEVVRNSNRELATSLETHESFESSVRSQSIDIGREKITVRIHKEAAQSTAELGIELLDIRIKRINYREDVREKVYERMISERKRIAELYRSEGQGRKAEIDGEREKEFQRITSEAYRTAQEVKGEADAKATRIYANAFNRDPEFYQFMQTLESYASTMKSNTTLILKTDSEYLKYLKNLRP